MNRPIVGRSAQRTLPNRFERITLEPTGDPRDDEGVDGGTRRVPTQFLPDRTRSIIAENDSPDVPFRYSVNPYRGCEHGCAYCYARPSHELLGMDAGLDFETKILVKHDAAAVLRQDLNRADWKGEHIAVSGITDCYQPAERQWKLTRQCLQVFHEARQPYSIVTKNALVVRDLDTIQSMAAEGCAQVNVSITTLDENLARTLEPRTSTPSARIRAITQLSTAEVPVRVLVAPVIPGLNDQEIPAILKAAHAAGADAAGFVLLRLPLTVRPVFEEWLARTLPLQRDRILGLIRSTRQGRLNDSRFGSRMRGEGAYAEQIGQTFHVFAQRLGLDRPLPELNRSQFRPPPLPSGQMRLF